MDRKELYCETLGKPRHKEFADFVGGGLTSNQVNEWLNHKKQKKHIPGGKVDLLIRNGAKRWYAERVISARH